ncbi:MAG TPA: hypothetical protein VMW52_02635 [Phycisphaerae bacterium]|nr:hypothetical protein [Phycisphaerae bacterium]
MGSTTVSFDCPVSPWMVGAAAAIALAVVVAFTRRDAAHLARRWRTAILALVVAATLMLTGLTLSPTLVRTWPDPAKPRCALVVDASRSMLFADTYTGETADWLAKHLPAQDAAAAGKVSREQVARALLSVGPDGWLAALRDRFDLEAWQFSANLSAMALDRRGDPGPETPEFAVDPEGYATALGDALDAVAAGGDDRPRAVVLISDGAWNTGRDPTEVARRLGHLGVAVFVVGLGDPDPPRDASILDLRGPKNALLGDEVILTARVATSGMGAVRLPVELVCDGHVLETKSMVTLPSGQPVNVNFTFVPESPGRRRFDVRIPKQQAEQSTDNNAAGLTVEIVERKIGVLLADGEPRWEFRFLRNVLERDPAVHVSLFLARPGVGPVTGGEYLAQLPTQKKDLAAYDLVILGDLALDKLPDAFLPEVADMVRQRGAGLILTAGKREHYRRLAGTPLAAILPVTLDDAVGLGGNVAEPFSPELTQDGAAHLVTRLADGAQENEAAWSRLPPIRWSAGVGGLARGATALLVHPYRIAGTSKMPLAAVHRVGAGKVMFVGIEETWRWRRGVGDPWHYRFWAQTVRWMVKKQFAEGDPRGRLSVDRSECDVGETVQVEAYCLGPDGFPLQGASVWLKVTDGRGGSQRLAMPPPSTDRWGIYRTSFTPTAPATYQMQPIVSTYGDEPLASSATLQVTRVDLEKGLLAQNASALTAIATTSGGRRLGVHEVGRLPALLAAKTESRPLTAEYALCRHWAYYTVLAVLLGSAWLIRKRSGLA